MDFRAVRWLVRKIPQLEPETSAWFVSGARGKHCPLSAFPLRAEDSDLCFAFQRSGSAIEVLFRQAIKSPDILKPCDEQSHVVTP